MDRARVGRRATPSPACLRQDYGVAKGDRVLVQSANCNQMFEAVFGCWRAGAVWVPANFRQSPDDVAYLAQSSGAKVLLCGAEFADHARACALPTIAIGAAEFGPDYEALIAPHLGQPQPVAEVFRDDPCWFFLHIGHHGSAKGGGADAWADGLCHHQPPVRPDARDRARGCLACGGALVAWRGRASTEPSSAWGENHPAQGREV